MSSKLESSPLINLMSNREETEKSNVLFTITTLENSDSFHRVLQNIGFKEMHEDSQGLMSYRHCSEKNAANIIKVGFDEEHKIGAFITKWRKSDEIPKRLEEPLRFENRIAQLWIKPLTLSKMMDRLREDFRGLKVTWFSGIADPKLCRGIRRPEVERSLQYGGEDGLKTLEEMKKEYGIMPKIVEFSIPNVGGYRIDNRGIVTVRQGTLGPVYDAILKAVSDIQPLLESFDQSRVETVPSTLSEYSLNLRKVSPLTVKLGRPLFTSELDRFEYIVSREELFSTMNRYVREGDDESVASYYSLYLDEKNYASFGVDFSGSDYTFSIYPDKEKSLPSMISFYSALYDNLERGIEAA
ncbi:MAG: hypothetical protein KAR39_05305 [Thermoplasmata archaeon]|nr:hypothetical protein [Thermoplasmata archaeon]